MLVACSLDFFEELLSLPHVLCLAYATATLVAATSPHRRATSPATTAVATAATTHTGLAFVQSSYIGSSIEAINLAHIMLERKVDPF